MSTVAIRFRFSEWLTSHTLQWQLAFTVFIIVLACFFTITTTVVVDDYRFARSTMLNSLETLAETLAETSTAAVVFKDTEVAKAILKSLKSDNSVIAAKLTNARGETLADYQAGDEFPAFPQIEFSGTTQHEIRNRHAYVSAPVVLEKEIVGAIWIVANTRILQHRVWNLIVLALVLAFFSLALAATLVKFLTSPLLRRIDALVATSQKLSAANDYNLRVSPEGSDELSLLMVQFNRMLENIQHQDTELRQTRDTLALRAQDLERSNAELEQFAFVSSHDLKEPLRTVVSYLELLSIRYANQLDERALEYIDRTVLATKRMSRLIQALLDFSRIGHAAQPKGMLSLRAIVDDATKNSAELVRTSGAAIECCDDTMLYGFQSELTRLFQNLIENAIKYSRPGIRPHIAITVERSGTETLIHFRDNGMGIDSKYFDKIFDVFQRLDSSRTSDGTGIGLAICKKIVELHGGKISVSSVPGSETTFHLRFPLTDAITTTNSLESYYGSQLLPKELQ